MYNCCVQIKNKELELHSQEAALKGTSTEAASFTPWSGSDLHVSITHVITEVENYCLGQKIFKIIITSGYPQKTYRNFFYNNGLKKPFIIIHKI